MVNGFEVRHQMTDPKECFLVAKDQEISRLGLSMLLEEIYPTARIEQSGNGKEAVALAARVRPELILMGIELPDLNGILATSQIISENPDAKVLIITAESTTQVITAALQAGALGYCLKNCNLKLLASAVSSVLVGALWLDPRICRQVSRLISEIKQEHFLVKEPNCANEILQLLSEREFEVLELLVQGFSNKEMADKLGVGVETIKTHMRHIMEKLEVEDRTQAAVKALRLGIVP